MTIGYIGLGKMGRNMVLRLKEKGHEVIAWNRGEEARRAIEKKGIETRETLTDLVAALPVPAMIWLMVSQSAVDSVLSELLPFLSKGDTIIDGGNCFYKDTIRRSKLLSKRGIHFLDAGVSGGPRGARTGACIMVGGEKKVFQKFSKLFRDVALSQGALYVGGHGAGHFVKMVHNGIEYGMMQALAEGFAILNTSRFNLDVTEVAKLYNHGSVIESRLVGWLESGFKKFGQNLRGVSGSVQHTGEGEWTVKVGKELGLRPKIIEESFKFRVRSAKNPSYTGKILSILRNQFGGHDK